MLRAYFCSRGKGKYKQRGHGIQFVLSEGHSSCSVKQDWRKRRWKEGKIRGKMKEVGSYLGR